MYFKKKKFCVAILASTLTLSLIGINHSQLVNAAEQTSIAYPFRTGEVALANSPTVKAPAQPIASGDTSLWYEQIFDNPVDLTGATYVGLEFKNLNNSNPGLTVGVMSNGQRFGSYIDGRPAYFVHENGTVDQLSVLYASLNFGANASGMILIPLSSLSIVGWGDQSATLSNATSIFLETNSVYNYNFSFVQFLLIKYYLHNSILHIINTIHSIQHFECFSQVSPCRFPRTSVCKPYKCKSFYRVCLLRKHLITSSCLI